MVYMLKSKDPSGEFVQARWRLPALPRVGELVMLPEAPSPRGGNALTAGVQWQEMRVEDVVHHPIEYEIWLGGSAGWEAGSVARLFANAREFFGRSLT